MTAPITPAEPSPISEQGDSCSQLPTGAHGAGRPYAISENRQKLLWDEYKVLQDKMDRVGDFRFRVKQWAVTLLIGVLLGGAAARSPWWLLLSCSVLVNVGFAMMELFHHLNSSSFAARAQRIELLLAVPAPGDPQDSGFRRPTIHGFTPAIAASVSEGQRQSRRRHPFLSRIANQPSVTFYAILLLASSAVSVWQAFPTGESITKIELVGDSWRSRNGTSDTAVGAPASTSLSQRVTLEGLSSANPVTTKPDGGSPSGVDASRQSETSGINNLATEIPSTGGIQPPTPSSP